MKYVLALLRNNIWEEAVTAYNNKVPKSLPNSENRADARGFDDNRKEFTRLRAVANIQLGTHSPAHRAMKEGELLAHLSAAVRLSPDSAQVHFAYAKQLEMQDRIIQAKAEYKKTKELGSGDLKSKASDKINQL